MQSQFFSAASAALAAVILAGCGSIMRGTSEEVAMQTSPPGALVTTDIGMSCIGPCILKVGRKKSFTATASAEGYNSASVSVGTKMSGAGVAGIGGNIIFGGVIGGGIDIATGATKDHFPNPVVLVLTPIDPNHPPRMVVPPAQSGPVVSMAEPEPQRPRYPLER